MKSSAWISSIFYLLGIGLLVPWNAFISAEPYFVTRICDQAVELWLGLVYNISSVVSLGVWLLYSWVREEYGSDNEPEKNLSTYSMVMGPLAIYLAVFVMTAALVFVPSIPHDIFFIITMFSLTVCGSMNAIASAGMVATASALATVGQLFAGQAMGGVAVSAANFAAALTEDPADHWDSFCEETENNVSRELNEVTSCSSYTVDWGVFSYFSLGCILLVVCLMGFHYVNSNQCDFYDPIPNVPDEEISQSSPLNVVDYLDDAQLEENVKPEQLTKTVWRKIRDPALSIFFNFVFTLAIFPGWTSSLKSVEHCVSNSRFNNDLFTPITFLWFNIFDLIGRLLAEKYSHLLDAKTNLLRCSLSRCVFLLLFMLLPSNHVTVRFTPILSDTFSFFIQALFAISNGFIISWSFLIAPTRLETVQEQVRSSSILNFCISFGLLTGSCLGFVYVQLATS